MSLPGRQRVDADCRRAAPGLVCRGVGGERGGRHKGDGRLERLEASWWGDAGPPDSGTPVLAMSVASRQAMPRLLDLDTCLARVRC